MAYNPGLGIMIPGYSQPDSAAPMTAPAPGLNQFGYTPEALPPEYQPQQFRGNSLIESLAGLQGVQLPTPHSFGEGFAYGLAGGLGAAGSKIASARQQFAAQQAAQRARVDAERARISQENRAGRQKAEEKQTEYERANPIVTQEDAAANPGLARLVGKRVPQEWLRPTSAAGEPLVQVQTPGGIVWTPRSEAVGKAAPANAGMASLDPEQAAFWYNFGKQGGNIPMGRAGVASPAAQSIARAGMAQEGGGGAGAGAAFGVGKQQAAANKAELQKFQSAHDLFDIAHKTIRQNLDLAAGAIKNSPDLGASVLNRPVRDVLKMTGNPNVKKIQTYLLAVRREYGKINSSMMPGGIAELPEGSRREMDALLNDNLPLGQVLAVGEAIDNEASNLVGNFGDKLSEIRQRGVRPSGTSEAGGGGGGQTAPKPTHRFNPATGKVEVIAGGQ